MDTQQTHHSHLDLSRVLVIDLEVACWQGPPPPGEEHEVIEIGNAILHVHDLHVEPGPEILVRPTRSTVSDFCTELTGLTQEALDERDLTFPEALGRLEGATGSCERPSGPAMAVTIGGCCGRSVSGTGSSSRSATRT